MSYSYTGAELYKSDYYVAGGAKITAEEALTKKDLIGKHGGLRDFGVYILGLFQIGGSESSYNGQRDFSSFTNNTGPAFPSFSLENKFNRKKSNKKTPTKGFWAGVITFEYFITSAN